MMRRFLAAAHLGAGAVALATAGAAAQSLDRLELLYDSAYFAWDAGDYPTALRQLDRLLAAPEADAFVAVAAELTGEVFATLEVAPDGRAVRWSADSRFAAFEVGTGEDRTTWIVAYENGRVRPVTTVTGHGLVFSPDAARAAYLAPADAAAVAAALAELEREEGGALSPQRRRVEQVRIEARHREIRVRELDDGRERVVPAPGVGRMALAFHPDGSTLYVQGEAAGASVTEIYRLAVGAAPVQVSQGPGSKGAPTLLPGGRHLTYAVSGGRFAAHRVGDDTVHSFAAESFAHSADGGTLAFLTEDGETRVLTVVSLAGRAPEVVQTLRSAAPMANPAPSPDGRRVAVQLRPRDSWELYVVDVESGAETRVTRDVQHDLFPRWLDDDRLFAVKGESRHRRSYLHDLRTGRSVRLHHNNTIRTVAPEYEWAPSPDGARLVIVADRDGNTIAPERGVFLMDLERPVSRSELRRRVSGQLAAELALREHGRRAFEPIADAVETAVAEVSTGRIHHYAWNLFRFDSKHITQPGNRLAIEYLERTLRSWGYEPELQWFEPAPGIRTANVVATLPGTANPEQIYVISSHFDSVVGSPGADDNSSGSTALLEVARVLAGRPQPATIRFAWLTAEESGLLGAQEFVRRAVAAGDRIAGVLNNDMIGWTRNHRLDNTIRYSNDGIRDIQHGAAIHFTDLITYDTRYYRGTDAAVFYGRYGDIVGGIGSYPILASPHYHQSHDILSNINQQLVAEVAKTTLATVMLLASSPARLGGLRFEARGAEVDLAWDAAHEADVRRYEVVYTRAGDDAPRSVTVDVPRATLAQPAPGSPIEVRAINAAGLRSWDGARLRPPR